jgi:hypothetical protein
MQSMIIPLQGQRVYVVRGLATAYQSNLIKVHESITADSARAAVASVLEGLIDAGYSGARFVSIPVVSDVTARILALEMCACIPCINPAERVLSFAGNTFGCCRECAENMAAMNDDNAEIISPVAVDPAAAPEVQA